MAHQYPFVLSNESIDWLVSRQEVRAAKARILAKMTTTSATSSNVSEYFTIPLTPTIRSELFETFGLQLSNVTTIPMRWIVGDTPPHHDIGSSYFSNTYLVYLTSSPGSLIVDGVAYSIQRGYGYVFSEGLSHETVGTTVTATTTAEPRLLLGPMSEMGFAVGGPRISRPGGTTVYIRQAAVGQIVEYSIDNQVNWYELYWYSHIHNSNTASGVLTIEFITDITIDATIGGNNGYFICITDNIQIGSRVLKPDGTRPVITINGVTNYPGFVQNGSGNGGGTSGYNNIFVMNLEIRAAGATDLVNGGGWIGQGHFGNNTTASSNVFINCHSTGIISNYSGGIVGHYSGPVKCVGCSSSGQIHEFGGGIVGSYSPSSAGQLRCESCWTTGAIGHAAGGITGRSTGGAVIMNCYSNGTIAENAGGISGHETGGTGGGNNYTVSECYSTGIINDLGGGIIGSDSGAVTITNCYSIGSILATGGGILGRVQGSNSTNKIITNCYTTGTTQHAHSYIVAAYTNVNTNLTVNTGTITLVNNYSEAANSSTGWSNTRANSVLTGVPASSNVPVGVKWVYAGNNTPYELYMMGHTPYTRTVVTGASTSPSIVRLFASSASAGTSSAAALITTGRSYSILQIAISGGSVGSYPTITMNPTTGAITTTRETALGTYTITLRNNGSYHITLYELTVTEAEAQPYNPCRCAGLFTNNAQVFYKSHSLGSGGVGSVRNHRLKVRRT